MNFPNKKPKWILPDNFSANSGKVYTFISPIGAGGNADVYECIDNNGNACAVKILKWDVAQPKQRFEQAKRRFEQEVSLMKQVKHEFLVSYFDDGIITGHPIDRRFPSCEFPFVIMDKAEENLFSYLEKCQWKVDYAIYAPQFRGLSAALGKLHEKAIHRDIKPSNILIKDELWLLSDFGLCTMADGSERIDVTLTNEKIGPKFCPSPESINQSYSGTSASIDASSDVYQLCAVFWLVLTGWYPLGQIKSDDYDNNEKNRLLFEKLLLALSHDKRKRPQNGSELFDIMYQVTIEQGLNP